MRWLVWRGNAQMACMDSPSAAQRVIDGWIADWKYANRRYGLGRLATLEATERARYRIDSTTQDCSSSLALDRADQDAADLTAHAAAQAARLGEQR